MSTALTACSLPSQQKTDCDFGRRAATSDDTYARDVAVIIAPTTSFVDFDKALDAAAPYIDDALGLKGARVSVIVADGTPALARTIPPETGDTDDDTHIINRHLVSRIREVAYCVTDSPDHPVTNPIQSDPESDLLAALNTASGSFDPQAPQGVERRIIVIGNGLQTAGQYRFSEAGVPSVAEVDNVVGTLAKQGALPHLADATVSFVGLGVVNKDHPVLNQQSRDALDAFWTSTVLASGGHLGTILHEVVDGMPAPGAIAVHEVTGLKNACVNESVAEADGIGFRPGSAEFLDPAAATQTAQGIAAKIVKSGCTGDITVTGYIASATSQANYVFGNAEDQQLSLARADAFKALLVQAGVSATINAVGGGKGPVNDWDASGAFVEELGAQNRKVVVTQ